MGRFKEIKHQAQVIIIGSGLAGLVAALQVEKGGGTVLLVSRSPLGKGTCTGWSAGAFTVATRGFTQEKHREKTLLAGHSINQNELVDELVSKGPKLLHQYAKDYKIQLQRRGTTGFRTVVDKGLPGKGLINPLVQAIEGKPRITPLEGVMVVKLIKDGGAVKGALGISRRGDLHLLKGNAVILATGGYAGLFPYHDNPPSISGSGLVLGALAGAGLKDLEFVQFFPLGFAHRGLPSFSLLPPFPPSLSLFNQRGEDLLRKYLPGVDLSTAASFYRDQLSRAMALQIRDHGPLYLDLSPLTPRDWEGYLGLKLLKKYPSFKGDRLGIAPIAHYSMGGLLIDKECRTGVKGLYGAGEVTGGFHGANRLGGNALTACLVTGHQAGIMALEEGGDHKVDFSAEGGFQERLGGEVLGVKRFRGELQSMMGQYLGPIRSGEGLKLLIGYLKEQRENLKGMKVKGEDLFHLLEIQSQILLSQLIARAALKREESRGAHYREDFPHTKEEPLQGEVVYCYKGMEVKEDAL